MSIDPTRSARPLRGPATGEARTASASASTAPQAAPATPSAALALDPAACPVDAERVAQVRQAIACGDYPLLPARVADAMIAAGLLLRTAP